jgi:hypothetical protein
MREIKRGPKVDGIFSKSILKFISLLENIS